jgi:lipopolysaccharide export LptBFGC system permease protein LptF
MSGSIMRLRTLAVALCTPSSVERVFEPLLADMAHDLRGATGARRALTQLRWEAAFWWSLLHVAIPEWRRRDDGAGVQTVRIAAATLAACTTLLVGLMLLQAATRYPADTSQLAAFGWLRSAFYLLPQAVVTLPIALLLAATLNRHHDGRCARQTLLVLTVAASVATVIVIVWVIPESNQAFRSIVFGGRGRLPSRGLNEMDLWTLLRAFKDAGWLAPTMSTTSVRLAFFSRIAFFVTPLLFAVLGDAIRRRFGRWNAALISSLFAAAFFFWYVGPDFEALIARGTVSPFVAAFGPNAVALAAALLLRLRSVNRAAIGPVA